MRALMFTFLAFLFFGCATADRPTDGQPLNNSFLGYENPSPTGLVYREASLATGAAPRLGGFYAQYLAGKECWTSLRIAYANAVVHTAYLYLFKEDGTVGVWSGIHPTERDSIETYNNPARTQAEAEARGYVYHPPRNPLRSLRSENDQVSWTSSGRTTLHWTISRGQNGDLRISNQAPLGGGAEGTMRCSG